MSRFQSTNLPTIRTDPEAENEVRKAVLDLLAKINQMSSALLDYDAETPTGPDSIVATNGDGDIVLTVGDLTLTLGSVTAVNATLTGYVSTSKLQGITDTTVVTNLNADLLDGYHASKTVGIDTIPVAYDDGSGNTILRVGKTGSYGQVAAARSSDGIGTVYFENILGEYKSSTVGGGGFFTWYTNVASVVAERMRLTNAGLLQIESLTASQSVQTNASKQLVSLANNGTGNNVLTDSPVFTTQISTPKELIGNIALSSAGAGLSVTSALSIVNVVNNELALAVMRSFSTVSTSGALIDLGHSKSATLGTDATTANGDNLGYLTFSGVNAAGTPRTAYAAYITAIQSGAAGATNVGADMVLFTGTNALAAVESMRLYSGGEKVTANAMVTPQDIGTLSIPTGYQAFYAGAVTITSLTLVGTAKIVIVS